MKYSFSMLVAALAVLPTLAFAQMAPISAVVVEKGKGTVSTAETIVLQGAITAINPATRHVVIKGGSGNELSFVAGPEVKNFAQLKVGDIVTLNYIQSLTFELKKGGKELRKRVESGETISAQPGEKPMGGESTSVRIISDVTAVNKKAGTISLRGPQRTLDLKVKDKSLLKDVAVGDQVESTFVEASVISVRPGTPAKGVK
ncbi:copper-binding protein [Propionivibrio sp.]|uniref:copper-binding protein n=1 Tax=Propionivibrio sp. TaxID=2212460 RepID=UPI003BF45CA1